MSTPVADSVRLALPAEAPQLAAVQRRAWAERLPAGLLEAAGDALDLEAMTTAWHTAIVRPPEARYRVLVAVDADGVRGFAATTPSADPDADPAGDGSVEEFVVDPAARRRGHGSRLLNACVDTLAADGFTRARWWVDSTDDTLRAFLTGAGWAADGAHREVGTADEGVRVRQVRLHTAIGADAGAPATA